MKLTLGSLALSTFSFVLFAAISFRRSPVPSEPEKRGSYGDRMALDGECCHIVMLLGAYYSLIGMLASVDAMLDGDSASTRSLLRIPLFYLSGMVMFMVWHLLAHYLPESNPLKRAHMVHHRNNYPSGDFYGDDTEEGQRLNQAKPTLLQLMSPFQSSTASLQHEGTLFMLMAVPVASAAFMQVPWHSIGLAAAMYLVVALVGSAIHISFHIRNFELEPYAWYRELRSLHLLHHETRKNFAMVNMILDFLLHTLQLSA